jgi:hypothetical protein
MAAFYSGRWEKMSPECLQYYLRHFSKCLNYPFKKGRQYSLGIFQRITITILGRAGHNFHCPLISPLSVDPLVNGTALNFHFNNVNLTGERLFLSFDFVEFV